MSRQLLVALLLIVGSVWSQNHALTCVPQTPYAGGEALCTCQYIPGTTPFPLTSGTTFPLRFSVTVGPAAYIPTSTAPQKNVIELEFKNGDTHKSFTFVAFATDQQITFTVADLTGSNLLNIVPITPVTPAKRLISLTTTQTNLRPGETSRPWTVRLTDASGLSLPHFGLTSFGATPSPLTLIIGVVSGSTLTTTFTPTTLTIAPGQSSAQFTITAATGNNFIGTTATVQVGFSTGVSVVYNWSGANGTAIVCVPASGPGSAAPGAATITSMPAGSSIAVGLQTAPWYLFLDYMTPGQAEFSPEANSVPVGGVDVIFNPDSITNKWTFTQGGQSVMWQKYSVIAQQSGTSGSIYFFQAQANWPAVPSSVVTLFNGAAAPAPVPPNGFPASLTFTARPRVFTIMLPNVGSFQVGDTFNVGVNLQQPLDQGLNVEIAVDCPNFLFETSAGWVSNGKITLSAGSTGGYVRARAAFPGSSTISFAMDPSSTAIYLFTRQTRTQAVTVTRPTVVVSDFPTVQYTGLESQAIRVMLSAPVTSSLTVVPFHPHCTANPSTITFTGSSQWARFTLKCLTTIANGGASSPNNNLGLFLAGPDRYNYNIGTALNAYVANPDLLFDLSTATSTYSVARGARRATVQMYGEDGNFNLPILHDKPISVFTNRAPDSSIVLAFYATNGATVTPSTVTLTQSSPNAIVYLRSSYPTSGQVGFVIAGPDAHQYEASTPQAFTSTLRNVAVTRICTTAELDAGINCGSANTSVPVSNPIQLNPGNSFLTTFNFTSSVPTINGLTISISNPNLVITPNPVTIPAGQQTAQFTVQTGVGGSHELYFSYEGAPDMYIYNSPTLGSTTLPVIVSQPTVGQGSTAFPANSGIQTVVPAVLIALLVVLLALF